MSGPSVVDVTLTSHSARPRLRLPRGLRVVLFANTDWYLYNFRLALAKELLERGCEVSMVAPPGAYAERFASHGLRYVAFSFARLSLNPLHQASAVARLGALYRREKPDLAHHFTIKCAVYGSLAARMAGRPAVVNALAGLGSAFAERGGRFRHVRMVVRPTLKLALGGTEVIVQNPEDRALMVGGGLTRESSTTLIRGSGVDLQRFTPAGRTGRTGCRVLLASRLLRSKGIDAFEEAARRVKPGRTVDFLLAGAPDPGNPDTLLPHELKALESRGHVQVLGQVDDMAALLSSVDVVVLPTTYGEGVPRILVEAAAAGLPLIATDAAGCRDIVRPEQNGFLIPPRDPAALACAVTRLLDDDHLRAVMGASSREVAAEFSEDLVIEQTLDVYARALGLAPSALTAAHTS